MTLTATLTDTITGETYKLNGETKLELYADALNKMGGSLDNFDGDA